MEAIRPFAIDRTRTKRSKVVVWMRKKNITQSYVFWKFEAGEKIAKLEKAGWTRMETPKSLFG